MRFLNMVHGNQKIIVSQKQRARTPLMIGACQLSATISTFQKPGILVTARQSFSIVSGLTI